MVAEEASAVNVYIYWLFVFTVVFLAMALWATVEHIHGSIQRRRGGVVVVNRAKYDAVLYALDQLRIEHTGCEQEKAALRKEIDELSEGHDTVVSVEEFIARQRKSNA